MTQTINFISNIEKSFDFSAETNSPGLSTAATDVSNIATSPRRQVKLYMLSDWHLILKWISAQSWTIYEIREEASEERLYLMIT